MSPPKDKRLNIGDWVTVHSYVKFDHDSEKRRIMEKTKDTFDGQIVGGTTKQLGTIEGGGHIRDSIFGYEGDYDPPYLSVEKTVFVWLVRRGITNKDIYVLPEDLTHHKNYEGTLPWKWANSPPWTDVQRKYLSEDVKHAPRNRRGQFTKGHSLQKDEKKSNITDCVGSGE